MCFTEYSSCTSLRMIIIWITFIHKYNTHVYTMNRMPDASWLYSFGLVHHIRIYEPYTADNKRVCAVDCVGIVLLFSLSTHTFESYDHVQRMIFEAIDRFAIMFMSHDTFCICITNNANEKKKEKTYKTHFVEHGFFYIMCTT